MDPGTLSAIQGFAAITMILLAAAVGVTGLRWVWIRTGKRPAADLDGTGDLRERLEEQERRVAELEERVDFSERLLAQQNEQAKVERPR